MLDYLTRKFKKISNEENNVYVNKFQDGYIVIDGNRMAKINENGSVNLFEKNVYMVSTTEDWAFIENSDGTATLIAYNKELSGEISIPTEIKDKKTNKTYTVTALGNEIFNYASNLTSVNMDAAIGLKTIGNKAFANCTNLKINVPEDLPTTLEKLEDNAFLNCTNLTGNIDNILATNISLGKGVFANCPKLIGSIQNVFNQIFYIKEDGTPNQTIIAEGQFSGFSGLTGELVIPKYITEIGNNAFSNCSGITKLSFEEGSICTKIGNNAFDSTTGMASNLVIPDSVIQIGDSAFYKSGITGLKLSANLQKIGEKTFRGSKIAGTLTIPKTLKEINNWAFAEINISTLNFETDGTSGTQTIKTAAFIYNFNLEKINFPSTITNIEAWGFLSDSAINNIEFPDSLTTIGERAFESCNKMTISHWSTKLTTIGKQVFNACTNLTSLPDSTSLVSIGQECFIGCTSLGKTASNGKTDIIQYLQKSKITNVGSACFKNCTYLNGSYTGEVKNKDNSSITIGSSAFTGTGVVRSADFNITGTKIAANAYNGVTEFKQNGSVVTSITIPSGVTSVGASAFAGCTSITSVTIPKTVKELGANVFQNCTNLQKVIFESENTVLTNIPDYCFDGCKKITSVQNVPANITKFGNYSFQYCEMLTTISIPAKVIFLGSGTFKGAGINTVELPANLTSIGYECFRSSKITKITIPDSVTSIGNSIFEKSNLQEIILGKGITKTSPYLFIYCSKLTKVTFRGELTKIEFQTFKGCSKLQLSGINGLDWKKLTNIGKEAFSDCTSLTGKVQLSSGCAVDNTALNNCPLTFYK